MSHLLKSLAGTGALVAESGVEAAANGGARGVGHSIQRGVDLRGRADIISALEHYFSSGVLMEIYRGKKIGLIQ